MLNILLITLITIVFLLKCYLNYRQMKAVKANYHQVPPEFTALITIDSHQKAAKYNLAKLRLLIGSDFIATLLILAFTVGGGIHYINQALLFINNNLAHFPLTFSLAIIITYFVITSLINLPLELYLTFHIEQKFGFNKTTVKTFISDLIKNIMLGLIIGVPLLYAILWLITIGGNFWYLWVWLFLVVFNLLIFIIYPIFIAPLFNKFTRLTDVILQNKIQQLLTHCGFKANGIFVMDASKRSTHGNAYFTGIGKARRIVFFDTLLKQLNHDEIIAILAHELGHFKEKHIIKQMLLSFTLLLIMLYIASQLLLNNNLYLLLQTPALLGNGLLFIAILLNLITVSPLTSYLSRRNEFAADAFAKNNANKDDLISALVKLYRDNATTLTPDSWYVRFYYSHPPAVVRIKRLQNQ